LTCLVDLRLSDLLEFGDADNFAEVMSGMHCLTRLDLNTIKAAPGVLANKTQLQHLSLLCFARTGVELWQLLSDLQQLQQLTHLSINVPREGNDRGDPPAAAFSALTASSKLHHLDVAYWALPAGAWKHVFPAGR
jgi:hypothetical protein